MNARGAFFSWAVAVTLFSVAGRSAAEGSPSLEPGTEIRLNPQADARLDLAEKWGKVLAEEQGLVGVELNEDELALFRAGVFKAIQGQPAPANMREVHVALEALKKTRFQKRTEAERRKNARVAALHFAELEARPGLERFGGAVCEILRPGRGSPPEVKQTVHVRYVGRLLDGTEFTAFGPLDMILVSHREPFPHWIESLSRLRPGGLARLHLPSDALGEEWTERGVPPGAAVVFEIELLSTTMTPPRALADALLPLAPEAPPPSSETEYSVSQLLETWGWIIGQNSAGPARALSADERSAWVGGLIAGMRGCSAPVSASDRSEVRVWVESLQRTATESAQRKRVADNEAFFRTLAGRPGVVQTPSGLRYQVVRPGHGSPPERGQIITVKFVGRLLDGTIVDSSPDDPLDTPFDRVMPGWAEGIRKIGTGGLITLYLPPSLGYGGVAMPTIPPGSVLVFELELLAVRNGP